MISNIKSNNTIILSENYHFKSLEYKLCECIVSNTDTFESQEQNVALLIENCENVVIDGSGMEMILDDNIMLFKIENSKNITFKNINFNYTHPSIIELKLVNIADYYEFAFDPRYNVINKDNHLTWFSSINGEKVQHDISAAQMFHKESDMIIRCSPYLLEKKTSKILISDGRIRVKFKDEVNFKIGDIYQLRNGKRHVAGAFINRSSNITFENVTFNYLPRMGIVSQLSSNITFEKVSFKSNSKYRMSTSEADCIHFSSCSGNININNCYFEAPHDDPINVHGVYMNVNQLAKDKLKLSFGHHQTQGINFYPKNSEIRLVNKKTLLPLLEKYLILESKIVDNEIFINLDKELTLDDEYVVENMSYLPAVNISNNTFINVPTRAILVGTSNKIEIYNNKFQNIYMATILICNDCNDWYESGATDNVLIYNNKFINIDGTALYVHPQASIRKKGSFVNNNIIFRDNIFDCNNDDIVKLENIKNFEIYNNKIGNGEIC